MMVSEAVGIALGRMVQFGAMPGAFGTRASHWDVSEPCAWHDRASTQNTGPLLEALAVVNGVTRSHLQTRWLSESTHTGLLVAVVGGIDNEDRPILRRMLHHAATPLAGARDVAAGTTICQETSNLVAPRA